MGLCNAPVTFQGLMNELFRDVLVIFVLFYLEDLLIFSETAEYHVDHVQTQLSRLRDQELYLSPKKCKFIQTEVEFLGL